MNGISGACDDASGAAATTTAADGTVTGETATEKKGVGAPEDARSGAAEEQGEGAVRAAAVTADAEVHGSAAPAGPVDRTPREGKGFKIIFLSSDTGGGHRASSESLAKQFQIYFPGTTYEIIDVLTDSCYPYNSVVPAYKHLSANPAQWKLVYEVSNTRAYHLLTDTHMAVMSEEKIRRRIESLEADAVVSVHPLMTNVPQIACRNISKESGASLPIFTVVTDLGSAHCTWFSRGCDRMYIASEQIRRLAMTRGKVREEQIVMTGLPIRHAFAEQAEAMGERTSDAGRQHRRHIRESLGLADVHTVLLMGGGEGVGGLSDVTDALYLELSARGLDATIAVVCGRNAALAEDLQTRDYDALRHANPAYLPVTNEKCFGVTPAPERCFGPKVAEALERYTPTKLILPLVTSTSNLEGYGVFARVVEQFSPPKEGSVAPSDPPALDLDDAYRPSVGPGDADGSPAVRMLPAVSPGKVTVVGLGFITNMAEYMVAADVLVTKAGPGTIAEAASVGLPVMLTNFLPGQEEGNVDFVIEGKFGEYCDQPPDIARTVTDWLADPPRLAAMGRAAAACGRAHAAADIALDIGDRVVRVMQQNGEHREAARVEAERAAETEGAKGAAEVAEAARLDEETAELKRLAGDRIMNANSLLDLASLDV
eukprot:CAMPEP_0194275232 /NCGR_PEP_ID=MMETSP0169-20130528/8124_1 /TAXON_ID=218684 /ORGANISM="Corethron pennatum, Strain L29A3" /LENGTH=655 /DNA_ID=CAMNT_0039018647 /DNA_START=169 /DNA_END=2136 /DNA_ORIENTATION=-